MNNKLRQYYKRKEKDYDLYIQPFLENPICDIEENTLAKAREYIDGLIHCILDDKLAGSFPIDVGSILKGFGYEFYEVDLVKYLNPLGERTILVLGEGNRYCQ